jgi:hypothetical protein
MQASVEQVVWAICPGVKRPVCVECRLQASSSAELENDWNCTSASMAGTGTSVLLRLLVIKTVIVKRNTVFCSADWIYGVCSTI